MATITLSAGFPGDRCIRKAAVVLPEIVRLV